MGRSPSRWLMFIVVKSIFMQTDVTSIQCHCTRGCSDGFFCKTGGQCVMGWSGPTCQKQNIALGKPTQQSSTANDCKRAGNDTSKRAHCGYKNSTLAVDGKTSSDYWSGTCIHTQKKQQQAWWSVDLGERHQISDIKIFFPNPKKKRMKKFRALVDGHLCYQWSKNDPPTSPLLVTCDTSLIGHNITIVSGIVRNVILNLCEVEIYECSDGTFGADCSKQCHCRNVSEICNKTTGDCLSGCITEYTGPGCNTVCQDGWYGRNCKKRCGACLSQAVCNKETGQCPNETCEPGWRGKNCKKECNDGYFGGGCKRPCNCKDIDEVCNKTTGQCDKTGCQVGWTGPDCYTACADGTYGYNCSGTCGRCSYGDVCDKIEGGCSTGCQDGFFDPLCQECTDGYYGPDCVRCGQCFGNSACDKLTGQCPDACQAGWKGDNCEDVCDNGTYGLDCSGTCGWCRGDEMCDKNDGSCDNGCQEGFSTPLCQDCNGTFGYNCNETCGSCLGGKTCDSVTGRCPGDCHPQFEGEFCRLLKPVKASVGPYVWLYVVIVVLVIVVLLLVIYGRKRRRRSKKKPILMSSIEGTNDSDETCSVEPKPLRPPSYKSKNISAEQQDADNDTYVNIESTKVKVENLHEYIQDKPDRFEAEYKIIPKGLLHPHVAASAPENRSKNRYKSMDPYYHSRVVLGKLPDSDHSDYINASYIDGYKTERSYIATQGPNPVTIGDFWRMVWQEQCPIIVMLTNLSEGARVKCEQYWPDGDRAMVRGNLQITHQGAVKKADYIIREFTVLNIELDKKHHVTQLHYVTWPDHDVPSAPPLVRFWKVFRSMAALNTGPFIIHCSAGVGRTGTFIALDALVSQAREEGAVNLFEFVRKMRQDRVSMVQTKEQYYFLHVVLLEALYSEGTLMTPGTFDERLNEKIQSSQTQQNVIHTQWRHVEELRGVLTDAAVSDSLLEENIRKTRNKEILPPDVARPALRTPAPNTNDYINAVFIPTETDEKGLVVTQLPLPWTVVDFWRLVLDHNVRTVVILDSHNRVQAEDEGLYWPQISQVLSCEPFIVSKVETKKSKVTTVKVQVWQEDSAESVKHDVNLVYTNDSAELQETPINVADFLTLVNEIETLKDEGPIVIMCRDGASHSGLFCAALNIVQRLKSDSEIDIYLLIRQLQTIRPGFITSYAQYEFCFKLVKEFQKTVAVLYENYQASSPF